MPIKPVEPHRTTVRGQVRWRVIVPASEAGGKSKRRFFRTVEAARKFAAAVESIRQDHRSGIDVLPMAERAIVGRALQKLGGSVDKLVRAVEFFIAHNPEETREVLELVEEFLADRRRSGLTQSYIRPLQYRMRNFSAHFARRNSQDIRPEEIAAWLHGQGWAPATVQGCLKDVRTLFSFAMSRRYVSRNPAESVERPKVSRKVPSILSVADAERLMRAAERWDPGLTPTIALVLFGGLRPDEASRTRWEFMRAGVLQLPSEVTKNNKPRIIELGDLPTLRAWLALPGFQSQGPAGELPLWNLRYRMEAVRRATAIKGDPERVPPIGWAPDILRHSFVSYAVPLHGISRVGLMADHSEAVMRKHYLSPVPRSEAEKFWSILPKGME